ncbi:hypothetical protein MMC13_007157 [Lambiella insularis]|nr:hypothetical protein [Lambiella insularis]
MAQIFSLPVEIVVEIIRHLPIPSLLAFGTTSKYFHSLQSISLSTIRLGVFPTRIHAMISLLDISPDRSSLHDVQVILSERDSRTKKTVIRNQNATISNIIDKYQHSLRHLEITLWELQSAVEPIAKMRNLRSLSIRLDHPQARFLDIDRSFWTDSPASTVWNALYANKTRPKVLGRLRSLNLERCGITDYQLQRILEDNPNISDLRLRKCLYLTEDFFGYLAGSQVGQRLDVLHFTQNTAACADDRLLRHIGKLLNLTVGAPTSRDWYELTYVLVTFTTWVPQYQQRPGEEAE